MPRPRDRLEEEPVAGDLDQHELPVLIEADGTQLGLGRTPLAEIATQFRRAPGREVVDAVLGLHALVHVLVAREDDVHAVTDEERLDERTQIHLGSVTTARGVDRVVEEADLPRRLRRLELAREPLELLRVHVVAVEREELCRALHEGVIATAAHVKGREEALRRQVVVAERRVELDALREQRLIGARELALEILRLLAAVHVVAEHDHERERKAPVELPHAARDLVLQPAAGAAVADDREAHRVRPQRQSERLPDRPRDVRDARGKNEEEDRNAAPHVSAPHAHAVAAGNASGM